MSGSVFGVGLIAWTLVFMLPIAAGVVPRTMCTPLVLALTGAALGLGVITLVPAWMMALAPGAPAFAVSFGTSLVACAAGLLVFGWPHPQSRDARPSLLSPLIRYTCIACVTLSAAAILFDAVYWPFENGDGLAVYALFGRHMYETSTLPAFDGLADAYPMLVPVSYALTNWASGGLNEYLAKLVPGLMAVLGVAATGALAASLGTSATGWIAATIVAVTPVYGRWATTGYTDVPAALFIALAALFAIEWRRSRDVRALLLTGVMAGLAAWTKNSALAILPGLAWLALAGPVSLAGDRSRPWLAPAPRTGLLLAVGYVVTSAPWYLRSELVFGHAIPPTAYVDQAQHTLRAALAILRRDQFFGVAGWLFAGGVVSATIAVARGRDDEGSRALLLAFALPVYVAWWWIASYETRFLLIIVPLLAVLAALPLEALGRLVSRGSRSDRARWSIVAVGVAAVACAVSLRKTIEYKDVLVRNPWPADEVRHQVKLGGLWDVIAFTNGLPDGVRIGGVPPAARYHIRAERLPQVRFGTFDAPLLSYQGRVDVVVYRHPLPGFLPASVVPLLQTQDGFAAYAVNGAPGAGAYAP